MRDTEIILVNDQHPQQNEAFIDVWYLFVVVVVVISLGFPIYVII